MILSVDIGGTFIKFAIIDQKIIYKNKIKTPDGELIAKRILQLYNSLTNFKITGISISSAGQIDSETGEIIFAGPTIPNYTGQNIKKYLENKINIKVSIINDVSAAALAIKTNNALFISIGTGIGGAYINDSKLYKGQHNSELEIGHMLVGKTSFESQCSSLSLCKKFSEFFKYEVTGEEIEKLYLSKNEDALKILDDYFSTFALGIINIIYVLDPKKIFFGGGITEATFFDIEKIKKEVNKSSLYETKIEFEKIKIGNDASLIGAYNYFRRVNDKEK
ncbi:MAG: ROK family protein [Mycoplasmatales bacterium]